VGCFLLFNFFFSHFLIYCSFHQLNRNPKKPLTVLLVQEPLCCVLHLNYQCQRLIPQHRTRSRRPTHPYAMVCFELPVALAAQVLLPRVQDQASEISSVTVISGEARVEVGREIEMLEIPIRLPEESESTSSLHHHQQPLDHPNLHFTSRRIVSASSGCSKATGEVRPRSKSQTRRSEDVRREQQGGVAGSGSTT
jgi:hypothetical protein